MTKTATTAAQLTVGTMLAANGGTLIPDTRWTITRWGTVTQCEPMANGWYDLRVDFGDRWPSHVNVTPEHTFVTR